MDHGLLTIGQVADRSGMAHSALRFYEQRGLIASVRSDGGQRRYHREVLRRLAFIGVAQHVGLSLREIGAAMATLPADHAPSAAQWERLASRWTPMIEDRIRELEGLRDQLGSCIGCGCLSLRSCPLYNPSDAARSLGAGPRYLLGDDSSMVTTEPDHTR